MKHPNHTHPVSTSLTLLALLGITTLTASAQFTISDSAGLFTPSFRNSANTTWFGWGSGSFDASIDNELIDNPPVTIGVGGLDGTLNQQGLNDILSGSNNIYTGSFDNETLTLGIPTDGSIGTGFTTIIIQGRTAFGPFNGGIAPDFLAIGGIEPVEVTGNNSGGAGQFWAKYELPGNAASYTADFQILASATSISEIVVDTQWSSTGYATDSVQAVPEPSSALLAIMAGSVVVGLRRRRNA